MKLTLRDFNNTDDDYQACVDIWNATRGMTRPEIVQQWKDRDRHLGETYPIHRLIGEIDNKVVCYGQYAEESWAYQSGKYIWDFGIQPTINPAEVLPALYQKILSLLLENGATKILAQARSDEPYRVAFIEEQGYHQIQREPTSWLDVSRFEPAHFADHMARVANNGISIYSVAQLSEADPQWLQKLHAVVEAARMDVPAEDPPSPVSFEVFAKRVNDPGDRVTHKTRFVAVDTPEAGTDGVGRYVGITNLRYNVVDPTIAHTGLTGIDRAYRRQGIATALKVHSISQAKADGVRRIDTNNDENNPMLALNLKLGFQQGPTDLLYEKGVDG